MPTNVSFLVRENPVKSFLCFLAATLIPILTFFDVPIPKPAWSADIQRLEIHQLDTHIMLLDDQIERTSIRRLQVLRDQDQLRRKSEPVPDFYLKEQSLLESKIKRLESQLEEARERKVQISK